MEYRYNFNIKIFKTIAIYYSMPSRVYNAEPAMNIDHNYNHLNNMNHEFHHFNTGNNQIYITKIYIK